MRAVTDAVTHEVTELASLRSQIDAVDAEIIALLGRRFGYTQRIGALKLQNQLPAVDAIREAGQRERFRLLAQEAGVSSALVERVFRLVIDEVVAKHESLGLAPASASSSGRQ